MAYCLVVHFVLPRIYLMKFENLSMISRIAVVPLVVAGSPVIESRQIVDRGDLGAGTGCKSPQDNLRQGSDF